MTSISYNCNQCGRPGVARYEPEFLSEVEKWKPLLACNRCADYLVALRSCKDQIYDISCDLTVRPASKQELAALELITKRIASIVCQHHRVQTTWDQHYVHQILDHPNRSLTIIDAYAKGIKYLRDTAQAMDNRTGDPAPHHTASNARTDLSGLVSSTQAESDQSKSHTGANTTANLL